MLRSTTTASSLSRHLRHHHLRLHPSFLILSANTRSNGSSLQPRRGFSTESISFEPLLETTTSLIISLQSTTSLPWLVTIPLVAVAVRTFITLPFTIYSHKRTLKQLSLNPLIHAWSHTFRRQVARETYPDLPTTPKELVGKKVYNTPEKWTKEVLIRTRKKRVEVYRQFGCQYWKGFVGLIQIPVWVLASFSVRRVTGVGGWEAPMEVAAKRAKEVEGATDLGITQVTGVDEVTARVREEMQIGGIEGWFPDLLQPDPYMILPIVFSLTLFTNVMSASARASKEPTGWRKGLRNGLMGISIAAFPLTLGSPAVLLLYWITSGSYSLIQNAVLHQLMPPPKGIEPVGEKVPSWLKKAASEVKQT